MKMNRRIHILVIEDDVLLSDEIRDSLSDNFDVTIANSGEKGTQIAAERAPDLILLDIGLPNMDGISVCEDLRKKTVTRHVPIIVITGNSDEEKRILSYQQGADDFLTKPFSRKELLARVNSKVRRLMELAKPGTLDVLTCGNLELDTRSLEVRVAGRLVRLSVLEFNLLHFFLQNRSSVMSREKILASVWKGAVVSDRTVDTHIASLRKHLADFDHAICTIYGAGYVLKPLQENETLHP